MKKKIFALIMTVTLFAVMLTGCIQNDIGIKLNKDGTGSISAMIGIKKDFYENLKSLGSDPFEGKETTEYTYEDSTYVAYTEIKEYSSFEEIESALLEMTYETDFMEEAENPQEFETNNGELTPPIYEVETPEQDDHIFSSVNIEKNSGIFYSSYTFNAVMNPQSNDGLDYDMNDTFKVTLTVEMPEKITQSKGGTVDGNKITFDIADITESNELAATCESNNTGVMVGIAMALVLFAVGIFCLIKFKM